MFKDIIKELEELEQGTTVSIPVIPDEKGYLDKECPRSECQFIFKVNEQDWANIFTDEAVYCPRCREEAPSDHWWTTEQVEESKRQAVDYLKEKVKGALDTSLRKGAKEFNRKQSRNSFIKLSLSVTSKKPSPPSVLPLTARDVMEQEIKCENCFARFAVIGCAYFCPACGHNSVERTFDDSLNKVEAKLDNVDIIRSALETAGLKDEAENTTQSLIEGCFGDCVVAFQRLAEQLYIRIPENEPPPRNAFQKLQLGSELWQSTISKGYEDWLTPEELGRLNVLFQRRHLLAHTEGIVDQLYIDRSHDNSYRIGQRIVVSESDARQMLSLVRKLADALREELREIG
jgi:hypothetical protein